MTPDSPEDNPVPPSELTIPVEPSPDKTEIKPGEAAKPSKVKELMDKVTPVQDLGKVIIAFAGAIAATRTFFNGVVADNGTFVNFPLPNSLPDDFSPIIRGDKALKLDSIAFESSDFDDDDKAEFENAMSRMKYKTEASNLGIRGIVLTPLREVKETRVTVAGDGKGMFRPFTSNSVEHTISPPEPEKPQTQIKEYTVKLKNLKAHVPIFVGCICDVNTTQVKPAEDFSLSGKLSLTTSLRSIVQEDSRVFYVILVLVFLSAISVLSGLWNFTKFVCRKLGWL